MSQDYPIPPITAPTGPKLFISYRRADSASVAGRIYDRLAAYFGRDAIFKDVDNIPIGANFEQVITGVISQSAVTLVLVGTQWATIANERGRRLDDPQDVVRLEVEAALRRGMPVIPVLVEGAAQPDPAALPLSLRPLFARGAVSARNDPWFDADMSQLATLLGQWLPMRSAMPAAPAPAATGAPSGPGAHAPSVGKKLRRGWLATPLGLAAAVVLVLAVTLLGTAGLGLAGKGPFAALGDSVTPYATAPLQPTATAPPAEHVVLSQSLTTARRGWEVGDGCAFRSDGYHVTAPVGDILAYCKAPGIYTNFHLTARVHAPAGATLVQYALIFRATDTSNLDQMDIILHLVRSVPPTPVAGPGTPTPTTNYDTQSLWSMGSYVNGSFNDGPSGLVPAVITGRRDNTLEVYASGPSFTVLVNGTPLGSFVDAANDHAGSIGLGVESNLLGPDEAIYTSVRIATLG